MCDQTSIRPSIIKNSGSEGAIDHNFLHGEHDGLVPGVVAVDDLGVDVHVFKAMEDFIVSKIARDSIFINSTGLSLGITLGVIMQPTSAYFATLDLLENLDLLCTLHFSPFLTIIQSA